MFYIFHGDDDHKQREVVSNLISKLGDPAMLDLNTSRFNGVMAFSQLRQTCDSIPFLAPARIVIVSDLVQSKPGKDFISRLLDYLPNLPDSTRLIFLESKKLSDNNKLLKLAEKQKNGYVRLFTKPTGGQLNKWIQERTVSKDGQISPKAAHLLATSIGSDLNTLDNEIEKLVAYKGWNEDDVITAEDVSILSPYVAEANIFDLVDAIGNRNGKTASTLLQQMFNEGRDPFYIFSMFVRQFRLLIQIKELSKRGYNSPAIARELKMHGFVVGKLTQQARGFTLTELERIYHHLLEIDIAVKTGQGEMDTSLDLLVANLTITA